MPQAFLYLRGLPGVGKITVARELEKRLGWKLFWFHELKNAVYDIVKAHRIPRLMDEITAPVARHLLERGESVIYVRPSPDAATVEQMRRIAAGRDGCRFVVIRLAASNQTLHERVVQRTDPYRISKPEELDAYLRERVMEPVEGEHVVETDGLSPLETAEKVFSMVEEAKNAA